MGFDGRKLPIGIQDFEKLRNGNFVYVDKTEYIYKLVQTGAPYFLSRPRRFGKSLFLSTLRYYFEGRKELFEGLKISEMISEEPDAWTAYPVFYFDFNKDDYQREDALEAVLDDHLTKWEKEYAVKAGDKSLAARFQQLIEKVYSDANKGVVVLVDEYDKPLLEGGEDERIEHNKAVFKGFFSTLKSYDRYIKFVFITGVTKFSKVSIFSDLNQLYDITLNDEYSGICGITEAELKSVFASEIEAMAEASGVSTDKCLLRLKKMYDGYHFSEKSEGVYNPFSLLNALQKKKFDMYWFATGTPTFLIEKLKKSNYDFKKLTDGDIYANAATLTDYRADNPDPIPLFYQTGYLTIKAYDDRRMRYTLGYPNDEVKYGFIESLIPYYTHSRRNSRGLDIFEIDDCIENGDADKLRDIFTALFASLPYPADEAVIEQNFQNVIYIVFVLLGQYVHTELHSAKGRADCVVETDDYVYIFEFKRDRSAREALNQIEEKGYATPYAADKRTLYKVGVNFNSAERTIDEWVVE